MKNFRAALAFLALVGVTQAEPTHTWWDGTSSSMNVKASSTGTWTIGMNLNVDALMSFGQGGSRAQSTYGDDYSQAGNALFSVKGDGYYTQVNNYILWQDTKNVSYADRNMTVTMGWGGNWYSTLDNLTGLAGNAVPKGLQLGVTSTKDAANLSGGGAFSNGFNVYVADMKIQNGENGGVHDGANGSYDWSISETEKATATTLDDIATMTTIDQATLFVEHTYASGPADQLAKDPDRDYASDSGNYKTNITYTTFYLTVIGKDANGKDVVYNFMAQQDDKSTYGDAKEGTMAGGSAWYDVDFVEQITGINGEFVDSMVFVDSAMTSAQREQLMTNGLPEPTTATLSLMALAGLAARRRRR
ncbi:MAG: hypothetical protein IKZ10_04955 [Akkermansia sp.]|nr:hypothetical protein [Akkermansia sp.]